MLIILDELRPGKSPLADPRRVLVYKGEAARGPTAFNSRLNSCRYAKKQKRNTPMQNLINDLEALLQQDQSLISDGHILKNAVIERAAKMDAGLLRLLMQSDLIRKHFFVEVEGTLIFDKTRFQDFVSNKAFLPDSYTAFKNRIGLTDARGYLKESRDVVLAWPYKDCVLEGGQTKEDKARQEVFWNTTLAPDDISRLFEPKVLTGFERWDTEAVAAGAPKPVGRIADDDNLLIKGNNLLALHSLKSRYAGAVKLIFIDPPYNTGNDGFGYNDRFNKSAWLTFMRNRLEAARSLLSTSGSIWTTLDSEEAHYFKVLCDEVFGRDAFIADIAWKRRDGAPNDRKIGSIHDHIFVFSKTGAIVGNLNKSEASFNLMQRTEKADKEYRLFEEPFGFDERGPFRKVDSTGNAKGGRFVESLRYPVKNPFTGAIVYPREGRCWVYEQSVMEAMIADRRYFWGKDGKAGTPMRKLFTSEAGRGMTAPSIWEDVGLNQHAAREIELLFGSKAYFETPKPEALLRRIIEIATNPGDLVLDFFAGSGTTAAVAQKMGRRWIAVEQMDYIYDLTALRLKKVIGGEQGGISATANWKGGGSFVYAELARWNAKLADDIRDAVDATASAALRDRLRTEGYVRPGVELDELADAAFDALPLVDQKRVLIDCLDANHLYVNYGDMADEAYGIADEDMRVNRAFYGEKA